MPFTAEELNPSNPRLLINGISYTISLITLSKEVIFAEKYGSYKKTFELLNEDKTKIIELVYELIIDKNVFNNSFEEFYNLILTTSKDSLEEKSKELTRCFYEANSKSMPLVKNVERQKEINKINGIDEGGRPCYGVYFDSISKRYGTSLKDFYDLTLRNIHIMLKVIGDESYKELELEAALQGRKLKPRLNYEDVSPEQEKENDDQAREALKELQKRFEEKQKSKKV